jgi:hypothetical protein
VEVKARALLVDSDLAAKLFIDECLLVLDNFDAEARSRLLAWVRIAVVDIAMYL